MNRRDFLKGLVASVAALPFLGRVATPAPRYSYNASTTKVYALRDAIYTIDPQEVPTISRLALHDWPNHKVAWLQDTLTPVAYSDHYTYTQIFDGPADRQEAA